MSYYAILEIIENSSTNIDKSINIAKSIFPFYSFFIQNLPF